MRLLEEKYAHFGLFEDKISPTQTHPVFSEQVNATRFSARNGEIYVVEFTCSGSPFP